MDLQMRHYWDGSLSRGTLRPAILTTVKFAGATVANIRDGRFVTLSRLLQQDGHDGAVRALTSNVRGQQLLWDGER